jgi:hypothetical protein
MMGEIRARARVYLRFCPHAEPGTVVKLECGRVVVYWRDLDLMAKHRPEILIAVEPGVSEAA